MGRSPLRIATLALVAMLVLAALTTFAQPALAVDVAAAGGASSAWRLTSFECGGARGSGGVDDAGNLYVTCSVRNGVLRPTVQVYSAAGALRQTVDLPWYAADVAPSPDGSFVYVTRHGAQWVYRLNRGAAGQYTLDATWRLAKYPQWGSLYDPLGEFLSTDSAGNVYFSSGTWSTAPTSIVKYAPDGHYLTQFGSWANSWNPGIFYWMNAGIAVSRDGASVYVAEVGNNRVQRFDRGADGSYAFSLKWGNDPATDQDPRAGWCGSDVRNGRFSAPYDVGLDAHGRVFVLNTSCRQVEVFRTDGTWLFTQQLPNPYGGYVHGMAVDGAGDVYLPELNQVMRLGDAPAPVPTPTEPDWVADGYSGWAYATARAQGATVGAWRWTRTGWVYASFPTRTKLWMQPFAQGWLWGWKDGEWYALYTRDIAR